jgi:tetratricopeptide (TPR) repeat protein
MSSIARIVILLFFISLCVCDTHAKPTARDYLKRGDIQLNRNNLVGAIRNYSKAIELDPSFADAYIRRGMARRAKGSLNGAIEDFERAEEIDPESTYNNRHVADSYSNRGFIEMSDLQLGNAIDDFTKAIKSHGDAVHYYRRGQARLIDEDLKGAIEDFTQALTFNPPNDFLLSMIYANRGYALRLQGKNDEAQSDFEKGIKRNSGQRMIIELHLRSLETQIKEMRRRRIEAQRNIS